VDVLMNIQTLFKKYIYNIKNKSMFNIPNTKNSLVILTNLSFFNTFLYALLFL